jgi:acetyltransferase-like isoleucine patch superfamily enzyme
MSTKLTKNNIIALNISVGENLVMGNNSVIRADEVVLGDNVIIGDDVEIICEKLVLGNGCKIGKNTVIVSPEISLEEGVSIGKNVEAELNEYLRLGKFSVVGNRVVLAGQGISAGEFLWLKNDVIVGGGGCSGPRSYLKCGKNVAIFDKSYINLSESVSIGDGTALSYNVVLLTHGAWQPALMGYATKFGPVTIGAQCVVYLNSVVLPGVTIGDYATIGASSLVNKNVPDRSMASGNPAKVVKGPGNYPAALDDAAIDELMHQILQDYCTTLPSKGLIASKSDSTGGNFYLEAKYEEQLSRITYFGSEKKYDDQNVAHITLSYHPVPPENCGAVHFDLRNLTMLGKPTPLSEDLRDYLRRRAIKIFTGKPFRTIPLENLKRIKTKRNIPPNG